MKTAVVYWSGTGNTQMMAESVAEGAKTAGADVSVFTASEFSAEKLNEFDCIAFGCPSMGDEQLEEGEFEPMFNSCIPLLCGKKIALFGSYGWGDGEWMRDWEARMQSAGAELVGGAGLMCHETPDAEGLEECKELGRQLANA